MSDSLQPINCSIPGPPSMEFSRQEYWSRLPFLTPGDLHESGIKPMSLVSPALQADSSPLRPLGSPIRIQLLFRVTVLHEISKEENIKKSKGSSLNSELIQY